MGVSHRRLKGWEPTEVTDVYEDGKLVRRTVTRREPEFTRVEVDKLIASAELEADMNPYGIPYADATARENEHAFEADPIPTIDFSAKAIGDAQDAYYKQWPDVSTHGHLWRVKKKLGPTPPKA